MRVQIPIKARLTLAFAAGMAAVIAAIGAFLYFRLGADLISGIDFELRARAQAIVSALPEFDASNGPTVGSVMDPDEAFAQVLSASGDIIQTTRGVAGAPTLAVDDLGSLSGPRFLTRRVHGVDDPARLLAVPATMEGRSVVVVVGSTLGDRNDALSRLLLLLAIAGPVALAVSSCAGWMLAGAALRPVERMRSEAEAISGSEPDRRLGVPATGDELDRLATTLNGMLKRLEEAMERERRFVDDASHELRTPLGVLKVELDVALARPRSEEELVAALRAASEETDRVVALAEDLLVLARTRGGKLPVQRVPVPLRELLQEAYQPFKSRARSLGVALDLQAPDVTVRFDPVRVRQAVANLVDNALRHGGGKRITITARLERSVVEIEVLDSGSGFPPSVLGTAFDPFARGPAAPQNGEVGAGLGLAIVRAVAQAHGGQATAENVEGGGARVRIVMLAPSE
ncbi:MAG: HAMP domain-containing protein [Actinobacteria bacterium]|nr:MAG: HAMP domain-containing protein [Actinomycetota bacterium]